MSIEEKLLTIIKLIQYDYRKYADPKNADERIEQIIQAFKDDNWVQVVDEPHGITHVSIKGKK